LRKLVEGGYVNGWDDPRMPTVVGMRRRGFTPEGLRDFCKRVGIKKVLASRGYGRKELNELQHRPLQ
jgi:glutamyl/glutaminyl-tRNA synthetase